MSGYLIEYFDDDDGKKHYLELGTLSFPQISVIELDGTIIEENYKYFPQILKLIGPCDVGRYYGFGIIRNMQNELAGYFFNMSHSIFKNALDLFKEKEEKKKEIEEEEKRKREEAREKKKKEEEKRKREEAWEKKKKEEEEWEKYSKSNPDLSCNFCKDPLFKSLREYADARSIPIICRNCAAKPVLQRCHNCSNFVFRNQYTGKPYKYCRSCYNHLPKTSKS
jgi:hypothetical protein